MDPQQLLITSEFYSICNKCDLLKIVGGDIGSLKVIIKSAGLRVIIFVCKRVLQHK